MTLRPLSLTGAPSWRTNACLAVARSGAVPEEALTRAAVSGISDVDEQPAAPAAIIAPAATAHAAATARVTPLTPGRPRARRPRAAAARGRTVPGSAANP